MCSSGSSGSYQKGLRDGSCKLRPQICLSCCFIIWPAFDMTHTRMHTQDATVQNGKALGGANRGGKMSWGGRGDDTLATMCDETQPAPIIRDHHQSSAPCTPPSTKKTGEHTHRAARQNVEEGRFACGRGAERRACVRPTMRAAHVQSKDNSQTDTHVQAHMHTERGARTHAQSKQTRHTAR